MSVIQKLVSIIVPTYNRAHLIKETLHSILQQTHTNWECIIVDDHSTDATETVIAEFIKKDARFQFCKRPNSKRKGANACRNFGLFKSKGSYIQWFDSDDIMHADKLEKQLKALQNDVDFCVSKSIWYDKVNDKSLGFRSDVLKTDQSKIDFVKANIRWLTSNPIFKKEFIENHALLWDETLQQSQDYDFMTRVLFASEKYAVIDEALLKIAVHEGNMSVNLYQNSIKSKSNIAVRSKILKKYHAQLPLETREYLFNETLKVHKKITRNKLWKTCGFSIKEHAKNLKYIEVSFIRRTLYLLKLCVVTISYGLFRKGETQFIYKRTS